MRTKLLSTRNILVTAAALGLTLGLTVPTRAQDYRTVSYGSTEEVQRWIEALRKPAGSEKQMRP